MAGSQLTMGGQAQLGDLSANKTNGPTHQKEEERDQTARGKGKEERKFVVIVVAVIVICHCSSHSPFCFFLAYRVIQLNDDDEKSGKKEGPLSVCFLLE
jgi:hypothetical protein